MIWNPKYQPWIFDDRQMNKTILITGANGQLGSEIRELSPGFNYEFIFTDVEELDLTNPSYVDSFFTEHQIDFCINCAAYTAVDKAEDDPDAARKINVEAVKNLAMACAENNAIFLHVSTDFVFNGRSNIPYTEEDEADPVSVYGRTKLDGELAALNHNLGTIILRTSWLYSSFGNNFVKTMLRLGREKDRLSIIFDQVGTPTYGYDLALAILKIVDRLNTGQSNIMEVKGVYHFSNEGVASWYDFAMEIFLSRNIDIKVIPVRTSEYPTPATRPQFSVMDKQKIKQTFNIEIPHWKESLIRSLKLID